MTPEDRDIIYELERCNRIRWSCIVDDGLRAQLIETDILREAADEILRLRSALSSKEKEIERLREALTQIQEEASLSSPTAFNIATHALSQAQDAGT